MSKFNAINIPYGYCLKESNQFIRDSFPTSATFGTPGDKCLNNNINLAPGLFNHISLAQIAQQNSISANNLDIAFFENRKNEIQGTSQFTEVDYSNTSLQADRPVEFEKNLYVRRAGETLHAKPDAIISLFFSDSNINHLRDTVVTKVQQITAQSGVTGSNEGVIIQKPAMDDFFNYLINTFQNYKIYNGSICFVNTLDRSNLKTELMKLNSNVLQDYVSKMVSQINMYIYYYKDASQLPEQLSIPVKTSMKGSKTLEYNVGFSSGNSLGIASFSQVGNIM
jgi:hypothetical protein